MARIQYIKYFIHMIVVHILFVFYINSQQFVILLQHAVVTENAKWMDLVNALMDLRAMIAILQVNK